MLYRGFLRLVDLLPLPGARAQRIIALWVILSQALIAVTGSVVRVTASGLGCPTWPKCFDDSLVPIRHEDVPWWHQAIEFSNRQIAVWIVVTLSAAVVLAVTRARRRREVLVYAWIMPASTLVQGVLGGITVLTGLKWWVVGAHMLASCAMVWLAATLYIKIAQPDDGARSAAAPPVARRIVALSAAVMAFVLAAGVMVTGAGPHAGDRTNPEAIDRLHWSIPALTSVHGGLLVVYLVLLITAAFVAVRGGASDAVRRRLRIVFAVVCAQALIGVVQYFTNVPAVLVVLHVAGACSVIAETAILYQAMAPRTVRSSVTATEPGSRPSAGSASAPRA
ncbi:COX15/CtaA family protein [Tsukamurella sp. 8F]|uniref:COX15/CtaA family protein n=1 Tax=unclassified Tsukamurella TaxID=2633480 RepID=UPI0023B8ED93|nr:MULTISPECIES: COX15/CtaA family protein [unclassified Tsukamurella]MDF0528568.1 COX15/CtaA family protein [Tsukamurella sp. 8J]MDF0585530.1 COX15/CtaA family protein [Tsukamurella sp. 8F]